MKILALSDIHSRTETLKKLIKQAESREIDLIVIAGDLTNFGGKKQAEKAVNEIKKLNKKILCIPGNLDTKKCIEFAEKQGISVHAKKEKFMDYSFIGFGGATESIGNIIFTEQEIYAKLKNLIQREKKVFLITHSPPKNCSLDKSFSGKHIGSEAVRKIIEEFSPEFSVSGHCHEAFGKEIIGKTFCINVSSVKEGKMVLIDTKEKKTEMIEL